MPFTTSPNMSLTIPTVGLEPGPTFALDVNASLLLIDSHDHTTGKGVAIPTAGLNINADLSFMGFNATTLRSVRFSTQGSPIALGTDLNCLSVSGVDLYYRDGNGNTVRLTQSGSVAGTSGSIGNLISPATATYVSGTPAFVFQSAANTPASLDGGSLVLRNILASSKGITLNPPAALAANYSLTLMSALPGSTKLLTVDSSGNIGSTYDVDNSTIEVSSSSIRVKDAGIVTAKIADANVTGAKIETSPSVAGTPTVGAGLKVTSSGPTLTSLSSKTQGVSDGTRNLPAVVSEMPPNHGLLLLRGSVNSSGTTLIGEGFSVSHPGTGQYTITFTNAFNRTPVAVACGAASSRVAFVFNTTTTTCDIQLTNLSGTFTDAAFWFVVIGERA